MMARRLVVAIPIKDEADRLESCLDALLAQSRSHDLTIIALVNNSADDSAKIARRLGRHAAIHVHDVKLAPADATAGGARRLAMRLAAEHAGPDGVLFTTDADGRVAPDWFEQNLDALASGADTVAGRALIDPIDEANIPAALIAADALECRLAALLDRIASQIDPDPDDPWPRHDEHSGASIAVTVRAYHLAGGIPDIAAGEDREFFRQLRRSGARIRHAPDVTVTVSGRTEGRAKDGMADTIRRRLSSPDLFLDDRLEPVAGAVARFGLRKSIRLICAGRKGDHRRAADALQLSLAQFGPLVAGQTFGRAWDDIERRSPALVRRRISAADVTSEIDGAEQILRKLLDRRPSQSTVSVHEATVQPFLGRSETVPFPPSSDMRDTPLSELS